MSQYNSFLLNEIVAKTLGSLAALPVTVPLNALGSVAGAAGNTAAKTAGAVGKTGAATRKAATDTVGLTSTPEEKAAKEKAKRDKLITKTLKKDPVKAKFMNQAIHPNQKGKTSLNAHLEQGDFDNFLNEVIEEAGEQRLQRQVKAGVPGAKARLSQRQAAGKKRADSTEGLSDKDYDKAVKDRNKPSVDPLVKAKATRQERLKAFKQGSQSGLGSASRSAGERQGTRDSAAASIRKARSQRDEASTRAQGAEAKLARHQDSRQAARDRVKKRAWTPKTEKTSTPSRTERYKADAGYKAAKAEHRKEQATHYASTEKTKGILGFRKTRGQRTGQMRGKAEAQEEKSAMKARRKGMEGGLARRMLRRVTPGGRARMDKMHAKYATPGVGGTPQQQKTQSGLNPQGPDAEKKSVLQSKVATESRRGQFDKLIREG